MKIAVPIVLLIVLSSPLLAQTQDDARLNEVRAGPEPKQQKDLDTLQLASAHRERSESVEERTNGLWQSWTTSICEGCGGNTAPYQKTLQDNFTIQRGASLDPARPSGTPDSSQRRALPSRQYSQQIYTDLSTENIDQIRRMPRR